MFRFMDYIGLWFGCIFDTAKKDCPMEKYRDKTFEEKQTDVNISIKLLAAKQ